MIASSEEYKELENAVKESNDKYVSQLFEDYQFTDINKLSEISSYIGSQGIIKESIVRKFLDIDGLIIDIYNPYNTLFDKLAKIKPRNKSIELLMSSDKFNPNRVYKYHTVTNGSHKISISLPPLFSAVYYNYPRAIKLLLMRDDFDLELNSRCTLYSNENGINPIFLNIFEFMDLLLEYTFSYELASVIKNKDWNARRTILLTKTGKNEMTKIIKSGMEERGIDIDTYSYDKEIDDRIFQLLLVKNYEALLKLLKSGIIKEGNLIKSLGIVKQARFTKLREGTLISVPLLDVIVEIIDLEYNDEYAKKELFEILDVLTEKYLIVGYHREHNLLHYLVAHHMFNEGRYGSIIVKIIKRVLKSKFIKPSNINYHIGQYGTGRTPLYNSIILYKNYKNDNLEIMNTVRSYLKEIIKVFVTSDKINLDDVEYKSRYTVLHQLIDMYSLDKDDKFVIDLINYIVEQRVINYGRKYFYKDMNTGIIKLVPNYTRSPMLEGNEGTVMIRPILQHLLIKVLRDDSLSKYKKIIVKILENYKDINYIENGFDKKPHIHIIIDYFGTTISNKSISINENTISLAFDMFSLIIKYMDITVETEKYVRPVIYTLNKINDEDENASKLYNKMFQILHYADKETDIKDIPTFGGKKKSVPRKQRHVRKNESISSTKPKSKARS